MTTMQLKQIALASSLFFSCHLVFGATYAPLDQQQLNLFNPTDNTLSTQDIEKLTQEYLEVSNLLKNRQIQRADKKINQLIQQYPKESNFYSLRATSDLLKKDYTNAIKSYQKAIQLSPKDPRPHIGLATVYLQSGDNTQAKNSAKHALSIDNHSIPAYLVLAEATYQGNNPQDAESILITALNKAKGNSLQETNTADKLITYYILQKQPQKALTVAQNTLKHYPGNSLALSLLARSQINAKMTDQAIPTLEKLIRLDRKDARHRILLAKLLINHSGKEQEILRLLDEATAIMPDDPQAQIQKTVILTQLKLFPKALQANKKVKKLAPESGLAEALEGNIYLAEKKPDLALAAFQKSYQIKPSAKALSAITKTMLAQGKQSEVISFLEQELKKDPNNLAAHFIVGNIYQQQHNIHNAEKHYLAILAKQPDNAIILNNLAWIYHQQNNPKALTLIEKAYKKAPDSPEIVDTYAAILIKQGNLTKGLELYRQASKLAPLNYNTQYRLAHAYALNGQNEQAIKTLKTITNSGQNFSEKAAALALLKKLD